MEKSELNISNRTSKFFISKSDSTDKNDNSSRTTNSLTLYNHEMAELVDLNRVDAHPQRISARTSLDLINNAFMRACRLAEITRYDSLDVEVTIKNVRYIAEVLETVSVERARNKIM